MKAAQVLVIGAGMSGLVAIKSCLEENLDVICYEKSNSIGGNWQYKDDVISCAKTTTINLSKEAFCFSDFPFPVNYPNFPNNSEYVAYLRLYAKHFDLLPRIRLEHEVVAVDAGPNFSTLGNWKVTVRDLKSNANSEIIASKVIVCVGIYTKPHMASFDGLNEFRGKVMHTAEYKTPAGFDGKTVLVVGQGNSAYDCAVELSNVAKKVYCISKPGVLITSRIGKDGFPFDISIFTRFNIIKWSHWLCPKNQMVKDVYATCAPKIDRELYGLSPENFNSQAHIISINDHIVYAIATGRVLMKKPIRRFTEDSVIFEGDSTQYPIDVVMMATGYDIPDYSYINRDVISKDDLRFGLYKRIFPAKLDHPTLAFVGSARASVSTSILFETQSRFISMVFSGRVQLPSKFAMQSELDKEKKAPFATATKLPTVLFPYVDDLARRMGIKPNLWLTLLTDPKLYKALMFGSLVPAHFRLIGPNSWPKARETILTVGDRLIAAFGTLSPHEMRVKKRSKFRKHFGFLVIVSVAVNCMYWQHWLRKYVVDIMA